jgi:hypothetical protein
MYNSRVKNRKIKRFLIKLVNLTKFKTISFCINKKIILISVILWYASLFLNWIKITEDNTISYFNSFNKINIFNSSIIFIILTIILFILFSSTKKEKLKLFTHFNLKDWALLTLLNLIIILLSISSLSTIIWLKIFYLNINYDSWVIFAIISWILWLFASLRLKKESNNKIILNESDDDTKIVDNNNMKLPI